MNDFLKYLISHKQENDAALGCNLLFRFGVQTFKIAGCDVFLNIQHIAGTKSMADDARSRIHYLLKSPMTLLDM